MSGNRGVREIGQHTVYVNSPFSDHVMLSWICLKLKEISPKVSGLKCDNKQTKLKRSINSHLLDVLRLKSLQNTFVLICLAYHVQHGCSTIEYECVTIEFKRIKGQTREFSYWEA